jgi:transketolase
MPDGELAALAADIRRMVLEQSHRAHVGHIGSCLSIADILAALYGTALRLSRLDDPERDRFVLSKGHAALALYAVLCSKGWLSPEELDTFHADGSRLGVHPSHVLTGVEFSTGSLGHGLPIAAGLALGGRLLGSARRIFVLLSDAECNEGSTWEAIMFAAHQHLSSLIAIVDANGQQALGYTRDVLDLEPMAKRWEAFGWDVHEVDGHDPAALAAALASLDTRAGPPHVLVARTVFGRGVSFMERQLRWHYLPTNDDEYDRAMMEVSMTEVTGERCVAPSSAF